VKLAVVVADPDRYGGKHQHVVPVDSVCDRFRSEEIRSQRQRRAVLFDRTGGQQCD
jgi:hypothetical protein